MKIKELITRLKKLTPEQIKKILMVAGTAFTIELINLIVDLLKGWI